MKVEVLSYIFTFSHVASFHILENGVHGKAYGKCENKVKWTPSSCGFSCEELIYFLGEGDTTI